MAFRITDIRINQETEPLGMDLPRPLVSWTFAADGEMRQERMRFRVGIRR